MSRLAVALSLVVWMGCKEKAPKGYPTFQECFDDHTLVETLPTEEAIVICCLEHPINNVSPACGQTKADCINYLTDNLSQTSAGVDQVANACDDYLVQMEPPAK